MSIDERLSLEARGALVTLQDQPGENPVMVLQGPGGVGRNKAYQLLAELRAEGYLELTEARGERGRFTTTWRVPETGTRARFGDASPNGGPVPAAVILPPVPKTGTRPGPVPVSTALAVAVSSNGTSSTAKPEQEQEQHLAPNGKPLRPRDIVWDCLVDIYGEPTGPAHGKRNAAAKALRDYGATPDQILTMVRELAGTDRDWAVMTDAALASHFGAREALVAQVQARELGNGNGKLTAAGAARLAQTLREEGR